MCICKLSCGWQVAVPDGWNFEYEDDSGQYVLWPAKGDFTIRITPFQAEKGGVTAPAQVMKKAYEASLPSSAKPCRRHRYSLDGFDCMVFNEKHKERGKTVYTVYIGFFCDGNLLSISVWTTDRAQLPLADKIIDGLECNL